MRPIERFLQKPKSFWACVRFFSQEIGYSKHGTIIVPTLEDMLAVCVEAELDLSLLMLDDGVSELAHDLIAYFKERSRVLCEVVEPNLMNAEQAKKLFGELFDELDPKCPIPMNKQRKEKRAPAFLTGIVNMMVEQYSQGLPCDYDPRKLTTITRDGTPVRTLARRMDGAFPSVLNPVAVWEVKEYYYTTTFGSRVADGVYETLLDGVELENLHGTKGIKVKHYLMADAHYTWWTRGKPYLCRMFDMLHMGYVDEILFGTEVVAQMPRIVTEWVNVLENRGS